MKRGAEKAARVLLGVLFFAALAALMYVCFFGGGMAAAIVLIVSYAVSLFLMPALHEAGHLLFGALAGFRFLEVRFSFLQISRDGEKISVRFVNPLQTETAGHCRMYPAKIEGMGARFTLFVAGGVLAQAAYLIVCLPVCFTLGNAFLWATLGGSCVYCAYLFCFNLLPLAGEEGEFDGALLWGLLRRDPSARTAVALLTLQGQLFEGRTPGEAGQELLFDLPQLPEDDPNFSRLQYYRYLYFLDRGEKEQAAKSVLRLADCLEYILPDDLLSILAELTYTCAFLVRDKQEAERYHARMERAGGGNKAADVLRAWLAYALLIGDGAQAASLAAEYNNAIARTPLAGMRRLEEKLYAELYGG